MREYIPGTVIASKARAALGTDYVWGGNDLTKGVDCSGLVQQVFAAYGIDLPRLSYEQIGVGASVPKAKIQPGDLVFFDTDVTKKGPDHVGIYMGGGKFIHAPRPGKKVEIASLTDPYYGQRLMGIRRVPGVAGNASGLGVVDPVDFTSGSEEVHKSKTELAEEYGFSTAFFKSFPELNKLLNRATKNQWDHDLFTAELKNTKWWREHSDAQRKAIAMQKEDPATYKATLSATREAAAQAAVKMGAILSDKNLDRLAKNIVHFGWQDAQIQSFLGQFIKFNDKHVLGGQAGAAFQQLRTEAYDNGVAVNDDQLKNAAAYVVKGVSTMEKEQANLRGVAMGAYPAFADQIEAGAKMRDIASPYIQSMSRIMEVPDTDIDLYNSKIKYALNRMGQDGKPSPMSLTDFEEYLRQQPDWRKTNNAQNQMFTIGTQVLRDMGLR